MTFSHVHSQAMSRKILLQVTAPPVVVGLILFSACLVSAWYVNQLQANLAEILKNNVVSLQAAQQMEISVRQLNFNCFLFLIDPSKKWDQKIVQSDQQFEYWLKEARGSARTARELAFLADIEKAYGRYQDEFRKLKDKLLGTKGRTDFHTLTEQNPVKHIVVPCRGLVQENERMMDETAAESDQLSKNLRLVLLLLGIGGPLSGLVSGYGIARGLSRSIHRLSVRVQDMSQHLETEIGSVKILPGGDIQHLDRQLEHVVDRVQEVAHRFQRQQRELLRAEQLSAVGRLAASVAHEIRNPLTAVKMLVEVGLRSTNGSRLTDEDLRVIHDEVVRVESTVQDLLDFARPPAPQPSRCDLRDVVYQAVDLVRARARQQQVEIVAFCPHSCLEAEVDRNQLSTVLVNLFFNALDAMPKGGRLEVDLKQKPGQVEIQVRDTGPGIPAEMIADLFTPFVSGKETGTGLGLSISRRIIEEHGGCITAANRPAGEPGAQLTLLLPLSSQESLRA
jgi:two-component system sensor histidine kinase HydH